MTVETVEPNDDLPARHSVKTKDATIVFLTEMANIGAGLSLTLFLNGTVVSGNLISGQQYFSKTAEALKANASELADQFARYFENFGNDLYSVGEGKETPPTNFLHLEQASILKGDGGMFNIDKGLLRIKIEEIDGVIIGRFTKTLEN